MGEARLNRFFYGLGIHPGHHENFPIVRILDDSGDKSIGVEFKLGKIYFKWKLLRFGDQ